MPTGFNLMRVAAYPKTITSSGTGMVEAKLIDGVSVTTDAGTYYQYEVFQDAAQVYQTYKVTFASPGITTSAIYVYQMNGWGNNGVEEGGEYGSVTVKVNNAIAFSQGITYGKINWLDATLRNGVTSVEILVLGGQSSGDWHAEAGAGMGELEIYTLDSDYGLIL